MASETAKPSDAQPPAGAGGATTWRRRLGRLPLGGAAVVLLAVILGLVLATVNFGAGLGHVRVAMLSGGAGGNYATVVDRLAARARQRGGTIVNMASRGSVENVRRLVASADTCDVHFALVQDGIPLPSSSALELIGRLPRRETVFIIGRDAAGLTKFADLRGKKIGIGPAESGTEFVARTMFEADDLRPLGVVLENHELTAQLDLISAGTLDLGVFVLDEDAAVVRTAMRERGLQLASFEHLAAIARRVPFLSMGTIEAGQYDAVAVLPPAPHAVLRVDTLVMGNGCASRSEVLGLIEVLVEELPGFLAASKDFQTGALRRSAVAKEYYVAEGPGFADAYVPWLVDIMPLGNWLYIAMALSVLFNLTTLWHKVRLWRVDANREKAVQVVRDALGERLTPAEITVLVPTAEHARHRERIDAAIATLDALRTKTRQQQNSMVVPMGAEWMYRYEEEQMETLLTALRAFRARLDG